MAATVPPRAACAAGAPGSGRAAGSPTGTATFTASMAFPANCAAIAHFAHAGARCQGRKSSRPIPERQAAAGRRSARATGRTMALRPCWLVDRANSLQLLQQIDLAPAARTFAYMLFDKLAKSSPSSVPLNYGNISSTSRRAESSKFRIRPLIPRSPTWSGNSIRRRRRAWNIRVFTVLTGSA